MRHQRAYSERMPLLCLPVGAHLQHVSFSVQFLVRWAPSIAALLALNLCDGYVAHGRNALRSCSQ